jgi:hypothetical protein
MSCIKLDTVKIGRANANRIYNILICSQKRVEQAAIETEAEYHEKGPSTRSCSYKVAKLDDLIRAAGVLLWGVSSFPKPRGNDNDLVRMTFTTREYGRMHIMDLSMTEVIVCMNCARPYYTSQDGTITGWRDPYLSNWRQCGVQLMGKLQVCKKSKKLEYLTHTTELWLCTIGGRLIGNFRLALSSTKTGEPVEIWSMWLDYDMSSYSF